MIEVSYRQDSMKANEGYLIGKSKVRFGGCDTGARP